MFEVGKKYKYCGDGSIAECVFAGKTVSVLVDTKNSAEYTSRLPKRWKEWREPRTITRWVNVYDKDGELFIFPAALLASTKEFAQGAIVNTEELVYITTIPITYTEPHTEA